MSRHHLLHHNRQGRIKIDPYYRFVLLAAQQSGALFNENENENDHQQQQQRQECEQQLGLSLKKLQANLDEVPKRCWKRLDQMAGIEAVLHLTFLFCGVDAVSIALRHNVTCSSGLPSKLENELNGLTRLVRKIVKRTLDDRDWKEDIFTVLREAQRVSVLIFYMLKSYSSSSSSTTTPSSPASVSSVSSRSSSSSSPSTASSPTTPAVSDSYIKVRSERLVKQLEDIITAARISSSEGNVRMLVDAAGDLRAAIAAFASLK